MAWDVWKGIVEFFLVRVFWYSWGVVFTSMEFCRRFGVMFLVAEGR